MSERELLQRTAEIASEFLQSLDERPVWPPASVEDLRGRGATIEVEPHVIFQHTDDSLGPAGHDEWMAFIRDSEGNLVGLVSHEAKAGH